MYDSALAHAFDPTVLITSSVSGRVKELGEAITDQIHRLNSVYSGTRGEDLFKATNKTAQALVKLGRPIAFNTASGNNALLSNTTGVFNTASGNNALFSNTTGNENTATGGAALALNTTGFVNTATGTNALARNTTGSFNTATGDQALFFNTTGNSNIAVGFNAGSNLTMVRRPDGGAENGVMS